MPEENRVFDVSKPGHSSPSPTARPIIVGHRPTMSDPMVTDEHSSAGSYIETAPTRITVNDELPAQPPAETTTDKPQAAEPDNSSPWITPPAFGAAPPADGPLGPELGALSPESEPAAAETEPQAAEPAFAPEPPAEEVPAAEPSAEEPVGHIGNVEGLHVSPPKRKNRLGLIVLILLVLLAGAYLAIDSGLIKSSISLPFHVFKQKTAGTTAPAASQSQSQTAATTLPVGFTEYKLAGTALTFAAPTAWGQPSSSSDPGYTARSTTAKSDGTYAYLVNFATNKDVQIAVTSSKFLPPARSTQYYDYLQWCNGTNDGKFYFGVLHFLTSADKTDTPTTITCDQGPLADVTKLNSSTIVQLKTKDVGGTVLGDIYIKNLSNADLPAFRVKDAAMTNGTDIKQLLNTVKIPAGSAAGSSVSP